MTVAFIAMTLGGCGARTGTTFDAGYCREDADCSDGLFCSGEERCVEGACMAGPPPDCDDRDPCTLDRCIEAIDLGDGGGTGVADGGDPNVGGQCVHDETRVDADGDGFDALHRVPGCGDDCDDLDPTIHPGAEETCNGRDDDCDLAIDEGASYSIEGLDRRITFNDVASSRGGLAHNPATQTWGATFWDYRGGSADVYFLELEDDGRPRGESKLITREPGDAFGAEVIFDGRAYFVVWHDRRDGNFEVYANQLSADGEKLAADYRVTHSDGWSIYPRALWTGDELAIIWQDGRHQDESPSNFEIYLTFLDREGYEIEDDLRLTNDPGSSESPVFAVGQGPSGGAELGIAFVDDRGGSTEIYFMTVDLRGRPVMAPISVSSPGGSVPGRPTSDPAIVWTGDAFVVAWQEQQADDNMDVVAVRVPRDLPGVVGVPVALVTGSSWSRAPALMANGDEVLITFSDDRFGQYELFHARFDGRLSRRSDDLRLTRAAGDSVFGLLGRGLSSIGVLFNDQRDGNWEVYFQRLLCVTP